VLVRDQTHAARLLRLRNQGRDSSGKWLDHTEPGYNYRLSELACALGRIQLRRIDEILALRRQAAERYDSMLAGIPGLERPPLSLPRRTLSWFVYVVRLPEGVDRESIRAELARRSIASGRYFAPIHLQPVWRALNVGRISGDLSLTESIARRTLALPLFNRIAPEQQQEVASALRDAIAGYK
jgi:perosamine synthetase